MGEAGEDFGIGEGLAGGINDFFEEGDAAVGVGHRAGFFEPSGGGEDDVGVVGGFGGVDVLHDDQFSVFEGGFGMPGVGEGGDGVGGDDPDGFDFFGGEGVEELDGG